MQTLLAYRTHLLGGKYARKTVSMYASDIGELSIFLRGRQLQEITLADLQQWRAALLSAPGEPLEAKTVSRKVSAVINYFSWLTAVGAIVKDPSFSLVNERVQSPLPDYLYDSEIEHLYQVASDDPRMYLMVLLLLETGMKSSELYRLRVGDVDTSDRYRPELWIRHRGKGIRRERKVEVREQRFTRVYEAYRAQYQAAEVLFDFSDRFGRMLFAELQERSGIQKEVTPKTLRHTHVVRAYRRGEDPEQVFDRIGLALASRKEADEMYTRLAARGI